MKDDHGLLPGRVEGRRQADWILMDYLDVVVHVFTPETRELLPARAALGRGAGAGRRGRRVGRDA